MSGETVVDRWGSFGVKATLGDPTELNAGGMGLNATASGGNPSVSQDAGAAAGVGDEVEVRKPRNLGKELRSDQRVK